MVGLGGKLHQITVDHLRLNHTELSIYSNLCGTELNDRQIESLLHSSEGWISAVYLNLCSFAERGELPDDHSDIYEMFSAAMIDPLPEKQREFLIVLGIADEFSAEMAKFITENEDIKQLLSAMTRQNDSFEQRRMALMKHHNSMWINIFNSTCAYYYALIGRVEQIPEIFGEHRLSAVNYLAPGRPMMEMIENQVYLAQGAYVKVIGKSEGILAVCQGLHYALVALHVRIQTAAAYEKMGKHGEARAILKQALSDAVKDNMAMPFVENFIYLEPLFEGTMPEIEEGFLKKIILLGREYAQNCKNLGNEKTYPEQFKCLTQQELKLTELMAAHMSNKEIAARLYLSEGTVKQYINQIYSKLEIAGDTRTKRKQLLERFYNTNIWANREVSINGRCKHQSGSQTIEKLFQ